jgi:hypothetical protein
MNHAIFAQYCQENKARKKFQHKTRHRSKRVEFVTFTRNKVKEEVKRNSIKRVAPVSARKAPGATQSQNK